MIGPVGALGALGPGAAIGPIGGLGGAAGLTPSSHAPGAGGFGGALLSAIDSLQKSQDTASAQEVALATGKTTDTTTVVADVEAAQLAMEMASQVTGKAVQAVQTIFQTQA